MIQICNLSQHTGQNLHVTNQTRCLFSLVTFFSSIENCKFRMSFWDLFHFWSSQEMCFVRSQLTDCSWFIWKVHINPTQSTRVSDLHTTCFDRKSSVTMQQSDPSSHSFAVDSLFADQNVAAWVTQIYFIYTSGVSLCWQRGCSQTWICIDNTW